MLTSPLRAYLVLEVTHQGCQASGSMQSGKAKAAQPKAIGSLSTLDCSSPVGHKVPVVNGGYRAWPNGASTTVSPSVHDVAGVGSALPIPLRSKGPSAGDRGCRWPSLL